MKNIWCFVGPWFFFSSVCTWKTRLYFASIDINRKIYKSLTQTLWIANFTLRLEYNETCLFWPVGSLAFWTIQLYSSNNDCAKIMNEFFFLSFLPFSRSIFHIYVVCRFDDFYRCDKEHNRHSYLYVDNRYIRHNVYVSFLTGKC